jgi:chorismate mutase
MRIDAFIYGHLAHKTETIRLKSEIAELKKQHQPSMSVNPEREQKTREKLQLLLLGDSHLSNNQILPLFSKFGFGRENLELETEYEKYRTFDTNNLLAVRSRYDGILLGPMPHSMKGDLTIGDGLIVQMQREPERYPPFVVVRDKKGDLKISKSSLKNAIKDLVSLIEKVEKYVQ